MNESKKRGRPRKEPVVCSVDDCPGYAKSKGMCLTHYLRTTRFGRTERVQTEYGAPKRFVEERVPLMSPDECELDWSYSMSCGRPSLTGEVAVRYAYRLLHNCEPKGQLNHIRSCNNAACWNPYHVYDGTKQENSDDVAATTKWKASNRKLTDDEVRVIRKDNRSHNSIAKSYGISRSTVSRIKSKIYYNHVL